LSTAANRSFRRGRGIGTLEGVNDLSTGSPLSLRTPQDVLAATPYLLGFHPDNSVVLFGCKGVRLVFHLRGDLPPPDEVAGLAAGLAGLLQARQITDVLAIGYGADAAVAPVIRALERELKRRRIKVRELLRAEGGRYWSYLCDNPLCCPLDGTAYEIATTAIAAKATVTGRVVLPNREAVVRALDPPVGPALAAMRAATDRAGVRLCGLLERGDARVLLDRAAEAAIADGLARYEEGAAGRLDDEEVAWLSLLLQTLRVRDRAWQRIDAGGRPVWPVHERLWLDVLTRCEPGLAAPAGVLLAYTLWRMGDGVRAVVAVERALAADPDYSAAHLMGSVLANAVPPSTLAKVRRRRNQPRSPGAYRRDR
jgi:Domain of unknown function (DUF4192)